MNSFINEAQAQTGKGITTSPAAQLAVAAAADQE